jgi:DNA-binding NarL/FixJ family response regulator
METEVVAPASPAAPAAAAPGAVRVVLADDHRIIREGLVWMLAQHPEIAVVGEAADGAEAVELVSQLQPDVVVMDVSMPKLNGIEATHQITGRFPAVRIIGLSMHREPHIEAAMRDAGAVAYACKDDPSEELVAIIMGATEDPS